MRNGIFHARSLFHTPSGDSKASVSCQPAAAYCHWEGMQLCRAWSVPCPQTGSHAGGSGQSPWEPPWSDPCSVKVPAATRPAWGSNCFTSPTHPSPASFSVHHTPCWCPLPLFCKVLTSLTSLISPRAQGSPVTLPNAPKVAGHITYELTLSSLSAQNLCFKALLTDLTNLQEEKEKLAHSPNDYTASVGPG